MTDCTHSQQLILLNDQFRQLNAFKDIPISAITKSLISSNLQCQVKSEASVPRLALIDASTYDVCQGITFFYT